MPEQNFLSNVTALHTTHTPYTRTHTRRFSYSLVTDHDEDQEEPDQENKNFGGLPSNQL